jgi:hypothetical protein
MNNKIKIAVISTMVVGISTLSVAPALASNQPEGKVSFFEKVALMMGFKKNLTPEKQAEKIAQMRQKHEAKQEARLNSLVTEGKITEAQKNELKAKLDAIEATKEANAGKSKQEVKAATKTAREDLKAWALANNLNLGDIMPAKTHSK